MSVLDSLVVDLQVNTAALRKGLDDATSMFSNFGKKIAELAEGAVVLEVLKTAMEGVAKAGEFMEQGIKDATALGSGPARELGETLEKVGLGARQLGADLMSDLAPALNGLIEYFTGGVDWGKVLAGVAYLLGEAFRAIVAPIVLGAGAIKGLAESGTLEGALKGADEAMGKLAKHGSDFAGSLKTAYEKAAQIADLQESASSKQIALQTQRFQEQHDALTGNRRLDRGAGVRSQFEDFDDALTKWQYRMQSAAGETLAAALAEARGATVVAEKHRLLADEYSKQADVAAEAMQSFDALKERLIQNAQAINNIHFGLSEQVKNIGLSANIRQQQFSNTYNPTAGFENFGDALSKQTKALENQAGLTAAAAIIEQQYGAAAQGTILALKAQADQEGRNAEAAKVAADAFFAVKDKLRDQLVGGLQVAGEAFLSKIGQLGTTINDAIKGFQQGGIWGALAALVMDLLSMMDGWKQIQNIAQGQLMMALKDMASGLNGIISGLRPLMGAIESIAHALHNVLNPILELIGKVLGALAPLFESIGISMQLMGPIINMICELLGAILVPILKLLNPILTVVALSFLGTELALEYLDLGLNMLVDWLDKTFGNGNNTGGVQAAQDQVNNTIVQMAMLVGALQTGSDGLGTLANQSANAADAMGAAANSANSAAAASSKFTREFSNVPEGIKTALLLFDAAAKAGSAAQPGGGATGHSGSGSGGGQPTSNNPGDYANQALGYGGGGAGKGTTVHVHVSGSIVTQNDLIDGLKKALKGNYGTQYGTLAGHHW